MTIPLLLATTSVAKAGEIQTIFSSLTDIPDISWITLRDLPLVPPPVDETGLNFLENARLKAQTLADWAGMAALADDSGLCVDALNGEPGLQSARWAGPDASDADRVRLLLGRLAGIPSDKRTAHFLCAVALALPGGRSIEAEGKREGIITETPQGHHGFGYDPIFFLPSLGMTMAEISAPQKNQISHRAQALTLLAQRISTFLAVA